MGDLTKERAVIEAARVVAADLADRASADLDMNERELLLAVEALGPPDPPEPGEGAVVLDKDGDAWVRKDGLWTCPGLDPRPWPSLVDAYSPLRRLVPESETFPTGLARRMAEQLADLIVAAADGGAPLPSTVSLARSVLAEAETALEKAGAR